MSKVKIIDRRSEVSIRSERTLLAKLHNPFIVNMYFAFQDFSNLYLVMDLLTGGDLRYQIARKKKFSEKETKFFIANITLALEYIHSKNIIHRDIKPENLVLEATGYVRVTDFGVAKVNEADNSSETSGTPGYMAPEVILVQNHTFPSDFFALGVIGFEFMQGYRPYLGRSRKEIKELIISRQARLKEEQLPEGWSAEVVDFINRLLQRKPSKRLGFNGAGEIKAHPWMSDIDWELLRTKQIVAPFVPSQHKENFDKAYCEGVDRVGEDTMERYHEYAEASIFPEVFTHYTYVNMDYINKYDAQNNQTVNKESTNPNLVTNFTTSSNSNSHTAQKISRPNTFKNKESRSKDIIFYNAYKNNVPNGNIEDGKKLLNGLTSNGTNRNHNATGNESTSNNQVVKSNNGSASMSENVYKNCMDVQSRRRNFNQSSLDVHRNSCSQTLEMNQNKSAKEYKESQESNANVKPRLSNQGLSSSQKLILLKGDQLKYKNLKRGSKIKLLGENTETDSKDNHQKEATRINNDININIIKHQKNLSLNGNNYNNNANNYNNFSGQKHKELTLSQKLIENFRKDDLKKKSLKSRSQKHFSDKEANLKNKILLWIQQNNKNKSKKHLMKPAVTGLQSPAATKKASNQGSANCSRSNKFIMSNFDSININNITNMHKHGFKSSSCSQNMSPNQHSYLFIEPKKPYVNYANNVAKYPNIYKLPPQKPMAINFVTINVKKEKKQKNLSLTGLGSSSVQSMQSMKNIHQYNKDSVKTANINNAIAQINQRFSSRKTSGKKRFDSCGKNINTIEDNMSNNNSNKKIKIAMNNKLKNYIYNPTMEHITSGY